MRYHNYRIDNFTKLMGSKYNLAGKKLLDVGAQDLPYKKYFDKVNYFSQDVVQNTEKTIDYIGDFCSGIFEIEDSSFDYILCTQVLEHLKEPQKAFREFNRVLKPGGLLFLTTHQSYEEHMIPHDFYRYTKYGLRYLGESNGFEVENIEPEGGVFQIIAVIFDTLPIRLFSKKDSVLYFFYIAIFTVPIFFFNLICYVLDFLDKDKNMTINYECIYKKVGLLS